MCPQEPGHVGSVAPETGCSKACGDGNPGHLKHQESPSPFSMLPHKEALRGPADSLYIIYRALSPGMGTHPQGYT